MANFFEDVLMPWKPLARSKRPKRDKKAEARQRALEQKAQAQADATAREAEEREATAARTARRSAGSELGTLQFFQRRG